MDWASVIIGVGGLLLGALTTLLSYLNQRDERKHTYRQILYSKQVDGCHAVIKYAAEMFKYASWLLREKEQDKIQEVEKKYNEANDNCWDAIAQWDLFLPQEVNEAMNDFGIAAGNIRDVNKLNQEEKDNIDKKIDETFWHLVSAMRGTLGTEPLSSETIGLFQTRNKDAHQAFSKRYTS